MRLPSDVNDDVQEDPSGTKALWTRGLLNGASQKVRDNCKYSCTVSSIKSAFSFWFEVSIL